MSLTEQIYAQAELLSGEIESGREALMELFCRSAAAGMEQRLRAGLTPEDCKADFIAAGALYALAALSETDPMETMERIRVGDVTLVSGGGTAAARCLRHQAELIISPYCGDRFLFRGV